MRRCSLCGLELPLSAFPRDKSKSLGRGYRCKSCDNERAKRYYADNREKILAGLRERDRSARLCVNCEEPTVSPKSPYCARCRDAALVRRSKRAALMTPEQRERERRRIERRDAGFGPGKTTARGYGHRHQQIRKQFARLVDAGGVHCARCGGLIIPGTPWDLGHVDGDRSRYSGPEHRRCNRATAARRRARVQRNPSRVW